MSQTSWEGLDELTAMWLGAHRYRCLGRDLAPFTLFHRELLRLAGHGLMEERPLNLAELELAVQVCSRPASLAGEVLRRKPRWWRRWWSALRALRWARRGEEQSAIFSAYLKTCCQVPDVMLEECEGGEERQVPSLLAMLGQLSAAGFDVKEVGGQWPAGLADWMYLVLASRETDVRFVTDEDRKYFEGLKMQRAMRDRREQEKQEEEKRTGMPREMRVLREVLGRERLVGDG